LLLKKSEQDFARSFLKLSQELYERLRPEVIKTDAEERFLRGYDAYVSFLEREDRKYKRKDWKLILTD